MPFITISSSARATGTDSNFTVFTDVQLRGYRAVRLKQATFYRTMYNVTDNTTEAPANNQFYFTVGTDPDDPDTWTPITISVPAGNYNIASLIAVMETLINTALSDASVSATIAITLSSVTNKLTFTLSSSGFYINIQPSYLLAPNQGLNLMLGFSRYTATGFTQQAVTAPRVVNLSRYLNLYIVTNMVFGRSYASLGNSSQAGSTVNQGQVMPILGSIPINADFGQVIVYQETLNDFLRIQPNLTQLTLQLIDDMGNPISLNGTVFNCVLEVE